MKNPTLIAAVLLLSFCSLTRAQEPAVAVSAGPELEAADVIAFRQHVDWLASPFMKGRMPGTPEMEFARQYVEWHFQRAGLEPAFGGSSDEGLAVGADSYRQPFELGGERGLGAVAVRVGDVDLAAGDDFRGMMSGADGKGTGSLVFAGYGIARIGNEYSGLDDDDKFDGKVVVIYGYAPMTEEGKSIHKGSRRSPWPRDADPFFKGAGMRDRGAAGVIIVVPPGVDDEGQGLDGIRDRGMQTWNSPVVAMTTEAFERLLKAGQTGETAMSLRQKADAGRVVVDLGVEATVATEIKMTPRMAENVGGLLRGKGTLANELIVVGAHIDHLGLGKFGSRAGAEGRGKIHPGADDNASGTAAIIMMAEQLVAHYRAQGDDANLRSVLFLGCDAEEQGLLGAIHYTKAPIVPLDRHALMVNFDMIGRITDRQLKVDGATSGTGLAELVRPLFAGSGLVIKEGETVMMASDHAAFYSAGVPVLFGIITPFHNEYHTPADTADKMNCEDAVRVVYLFNSVVKKVAAHPARIEFAGATPRRRGN